MTDYKLVPVERCAARGNEKPVSEMKTCMHNQMHRYVCDSKCMNDFYNPPKNPRSDAVAPAVQGEPTALSALQAECEKLRKDAGTERQIQRAAQHLPEGWRITVEVEKDAGWVDAFNPDGSRIEIDWIGSLAEQIEQAIDTAIQGDNP